MRSGGTHDGEASGFRLSALLKLKNTRTVDNKSSLLHYLVEYISNDPSLRPSLMFAADLKHVCEASKGVLLLFGVWCFGVDR